MSLALAALLTIAPAHPPARAVANRPDRALYLEARAAEEKLHASKRLETRRQEWESVASRYRRLVAKYPQSGYCDDALLAVGDLYRQMAVRFKSPRLNDDAVQAYKSLVAEYPSSSLGEKALYSVFELARDSGDRKRLAEAARGYLSTFPDSRRAAEVKAAVKKTAPERAAVLPTPPPPGLAQVYNLRFWSGESSTRVVIDLEKEVEIRQDRISGPDRLWVDLIGTRLHPNLSDRSFPVGDGLLEKIRIAQNRSDAVRVVLDFKNVKDHSVLYFHDPTRLVIDVRGAPSPVVADAGRGAPERQAEKPESRTAEPHGGEADFLDLPGTTPSPMPSPSPFAAAVSALPPAPSPSPLSGAVARSSPAPSPSPATAPSPLPSPSAPPPSRRAEKEPQPSPSPAPSAVREASAPLPPQVNRTGSYSLARQLGLGARRIVIDPGHGGHDPGTIGRGGLEEKDLVLDVALRLEKMLRGELGTDVIMTRSTDVFVRLEDRTAIATSRDADLFLSIHANSSRSPQARGIETYILNFAVDRHAEEVAARENAISAATLKDLQGLVKAIIVNNKIDESRDFASSIHESLVAHVSSGGDIQDRGVRTAPFYVLIGATMPSVLAEISFLSNPDDERLLRTPDYRDKIARSLFEGVKSYLEGLNRTRMPQQLTRNSGRTTVAGKGMRRR